LAKPVVGYAVAIGDSEQAGGQAKRVLPSGKWFVLLEQPLAPKPRIPGAAGGAAVVLAVFLTAYTLVPSSTPLGAGSVHHG
jgi:hypothetical protein